jgi:hypothetical protein
LHINLKTSLLLENILKGVEFETTNFRVLLEEGENLVQQPFCIIAVEEGFIEVEFEFVEGALGSFFAGTSSIGVDIGARQIFVLASEVLSIRPISSEVDLDMSRKGGKRYKWDQMKE